MQCLGGAFAAHLKDQTMNVFNLLAKHYGSATIDRLRHLPVDQWHNALCLRDVGETMVAINALRGVTVRPLAV